MAFVKKTWILNDIVQPDDMNRIESGIDDATSGKTITDKNETTTLTDESLFSVIKDSILYKIKYSSIVAALKNVFAITKTFTATIGTTWTTNTGYFTQDVSIPGILATDNPSIDIVQVDGAKDDTVNFAWGVIYKIKTSDGKITVYASEATTVNINIQLKVVR